jgi:hypothetical protein
MNIERAIRQIREDVANARETDDAYVEITTDVGATVLAEVDRLTKAQDRVWAIVGQRREAAKAAGLDPYADPIAQALAAALTDSPEPATTDKTGA